MIRFIAWCKENGYEPLPLDEEICYRFAVNSRHTAPTFLRSFLVSITFSFYVLGLTGGESCFNSARLKGAVKHSYLKKRKREQRDPLTVEQVRKLELLACGNIPGGVGTLGCVVLPNVYLHESKVQRWFEHGWLVCRLS